MLPCEKVQLSQMQIVFVASTILHTSLMKELIRHHFDLPEPKSVKVFPGAAVKCLRTFNDEDNLPDGCIRRTPELDCWLEHLLRTAPESVGQVTERCLLGSKKTMCCFLQVNVTFFFFLSVCFFATTEHIFSKFTE